jgi:hypothetical protein
VAAGLTALVLAGLIGFWAVDPFGGNDGSAAPRAPAGTSAPTSRPTAQKTSAAPPSTSATSEPTAPSTDAGSVRARDVDKAVKGFFKVLPGDLEAAHQLTSPAFQSKFPMDRFAAFWGQFKDVKVSNVRTEDGSTAATVDIQYMWPDGRRQTERHVLTFVIGDDGTLLLDADEGRGVIG